MGHKILIIEDSDSFGALLKSQLQKAGFDTLLVPDAMLGIKQTGQWKPDLVLLDLMLPAGGGVAVLRSIRQSVYTKTTPVLILTGSTDMALRKQILDLGVQTILQKPYKLDDLLSLIHNTLGIPPAAAA